MSKANMRIYKKRGLTVLVVGESFHCHPFHLDRNYSLWAFYSIDYYYIYYMSCDLEPTNQLTFLF